MTSSTPSILFVTPDFPAFPGWGGHDFLILKQLPQFTRVGLVSQIHFHEQAQGAEMLAQAGVNLYLWKNPLLEQALPGQEADFLPPPPPTWRRLTRQTWDFAHAALASTLQGAARPRDTFAQDFNFRNLSTPFLQAMRASPWDALVVIQSSHANWLERLPYFGTTVLILHDVRALVYERQAALEENSLARWLLTLEARRYRAFETRWLGKFSQAIAVSPADERWARQNLRASNIISVPLPVDADYFAPAEQAQEVPNRIVFTGMMNHAPNVDAACYFAHQVLPLIQRALPAAEFWIVGRDPTPEVCALSALPGVTVTGAVPDIRPHMAAAAAVVVPIRFGAGMRNKILEAWAMQKCVVSTSVGAEGLAYSLGETLLIGDDAPALAQNVISVLLDSTRRQRLQRGGRALVLEQHNPQRLTQRYFQVIQSAYQRTARFRALLDLRWMVPGRAGGIETVARALLNELPRQDMKNNYAVLIPASARASLPTLPSNFDLQSAESVAEKLRGLYLRAERRISARLALQNWHSPEVDTLRSLHRYQAEVALSIPGYIHPELYPLKNVLIVPDLQHEYFPQFFKPEELRLRQKIYSESIQAANYVCAISEFTRQTILEKIGVDPQKVVTTPLGVDLAYLPDSPHRNRAAEVCRRHRLPQGAYLFLPGKPWPHKNHAAALRVLKILRDQYRLQIPLVLTGSPRAEYGSLNEFIHQNGLEKQIYFLGRVPPHDLPGLYEGAAALLFPSLFEGFGMPILEAMACGCPVVCSNTSSLPEVAGDAALLCDPTDSAALAEALAGVLADTSLRAEMLKRGAQRYPLFTWQKFTAQVLDILTVVAGR